MENPEKRYAKIYDISNLVEPHYEVLGYVRNWNKDTNELIKSFIKDNNILPGDFLFTGSTYQSRQEYGYIIVTEPDDVNKWYPYPWRNGDDAMFLVNEKRIGEYIKRHNIKYKEMVESLEDMNIANFSYWNMDVEEKYKEMAIWD